MSHGHCILVHGFESGPDATKVTALAAVAERLGWTHERPDFTRFDAKRDAGELGDVPARLQRLLDLARAAEQRGPLVLAGSSLGSYICAQASLQISVRALLLLAPPIDLPSQPMLDAAPVPLSIVHGWDDELIPAQAVIAWARARRARVLLVDDDHRLSAHVGAAAAAFAELLQSL